MSKIVLKKGLKTFQVFWGKDQKGFCSEIFFDNGVDETGHKKERELDAVGASNTVTLFVNARINDGWTVTEVQLLS